MSNQNNANSSQLPIPAIKLSTELDQSFEINHDPFGSTADSSGRPSILGKESLQILHNISYLKDFDVSGRDSLGILNFNDVLIGDNSPSNSKNLTSFLLSDNSSREISPLNTGMCIYDSQCERKPSIYSSTSSFNSVSLNVPEPSRIWSLSSLERSEFNNGFIKSHLFNDSKSILNERIQEQHYRGRVLSLPAILGEIKRRSEAISKSEEKPKNIEECSDSLLDENVDNFNDSVFIEANYLASKIADGSIFDKSCEGEINILDSTPQPDFINDSDLNLSSEEKCDTEAVYKIIDKMLPPSNETTEKLPEPPVSNTISDKVTHNSHTSASSGGHVSTDVKDILDQLSSIINSDHKDVETKTLGQNLIANLTNLLINEKSSSQTESFDDFEQSSNKNVASAEDFGKKRNTSEGSPRVLDLSLKNKIENVKESMSQSFDSHGSKMSVPKLENNLQKQMIKLSGSLGRRHSDDVSRNVSVVDMKAKTSLSSFGNFKTKRFESTSRKGPLKAVVPISKIENNSSIKQSDNKVKLKQTTPKGQKEPIFISKKTSTPIEDPKIKPLAQSTPDREETNQLNVRACSSVIRNRKLTCPISPLARQSSRSLRSVELNKSDSLPNLGKNILMETNNNKSLSRRNSVTDFKNDQKPIIKRSHSLGKENSLNLQGVKENSLYNNKNIKNGAGSKKRENRSFLQENIRRVSGIRPFNLMATLKKSTKESVK